MNFNRRGLPTIATQDEQQTAKGSPSLSDRSQKSKTHLSAESLLEWRDTNMTEDTQFSSAGHNTPGSESSCLPLITRANS
jgi:hypothetical protein